MKYISESTDDGYNIVDCYLKKLKQTDDDPSNDYTPYNSLMHEIHRNKDSEYCGGIIRTYDGKYPVWAFVEIVPFGSFLNFLGFCADYFQEECFKTDFFLLKDVKRIRNVTAHNNCLIYNLKPNTTKYHTNNNVTRFLSDPKFGISKSSRQRKMSNSALNDIVTLIYTYVRIVKSSGVLNARRNNLNESIKRCYKNIDYYNYNDTILSAFNF